FDFTSVGGAASAFTSTFGRSDVWDSLASDREMKRLEATRNLIAHRGGLIDHQFVRLTSSDAEIGSLLALTSSGVLAYLALVTGYAQGIVRALDERLSE